MKSTARIFFLRLVFSWMVRRALAELSLLFVIISVLTMTDSAFSMDRENPKRDCSHCHSLSVAEASRLLDPLDVKVTSVQHSPFRGLYEIAADRNGKSGLIFMGYAMTHVMQGVMVKVDDLKRIHPSGPHSSEQENSASVSRLLKTNSILMGNPKAHKQIVVFADPDCSSCRKMHMELQKLVREMDVSVHIKLFPLPMHPNAYGKSRVLLGRNSLELLNRAFLGERIPSPGEKDSREPVDETIALAASLGIKGTPTFWFPNGRIEAGYKDVLTLKRLVEQNQDVKR